MAYENFNLMLQKGFDIDRWSLRKSGILRNGWPKIGTPSPPPSKARRTITPAKKVVTKKIDSKTKQEIKEEKKFEERATPAVAYAYLPKVYGLATVPGYILWAGEPDNYGMWIKSIFKIMVYQYMVEVAFAQDCRCVKYFTESYYDANGYVPRDPDLPYLERFRGFVNFSSGGSNYWLSYSDTWLETDLAMYYMASAPNGLPSDMYLYLWYRYHTYPPTIINTDYSKPGLQGIEWNNPCTETTMCSRPSYSNYNQFFSGGWSSYGYHTHLYPRHRVDSPASPSQPPPYNPNIGIYSSRHPGIAKAAFLQLDHQSNYDNKLHNYEAQICVNLFKDPGVEVKNGCWYREALLDLIRISGNEWEDYNINDWGIIDDLDDPRYFINMAFSDQITIKDAMLEICNAVGVICYFDYEKGKFQLRKQALEEYISVATFDAKEVQLTLTTETNEEIYSTYRGTYQEYETAEIFGQDMKTFTKESSVIVVQSDLNRRLVGYKKADTDFNMYYEPNPVQARLTEVLKQDSWKKHYGTARAPLKYYKIKPGEVVTVRDPEQLLSDIQMMVTSSSIEDTHVDFTLEQITPITSFYSEGGGGETGFGPAEIPIADEVEITKVPQNARSNWNPQYLLRIFPSVALLDYLENHATEQYRIMLYASDTETGNYSFYKYISEFSSYWEHIHPWNEPGEDPVLWDDLTEYPGHTKETDSYTIELRFGSFLTVGLQTSPLLVKLENEWIFAKTFETDPGSPNSIFLKGIARGQLGSLKASHTKWIHQGKIFRLWSESGDPSEYFGFDSSNNQLTYQNFRDYLEPKWIKVIFVMENGMKISPIETTPPVQITDVSEPLPWVPTHVKAVRSSTTVNISWHFRSPYQTFEGAGTKTPAGMVPHDTPLYTQGFRISINGGGLIDPGGYTYVVNDANSFTVTLYQYEYGRLGPGVTYTIGTNDGTYLNGVKI